MALRPYPPLRLDNIKSQLGGLPLLPGQESWPRAIDGKPLHFLARIDCSELPKTRSSLPVRGVLQFFARVDESMEYHGGVSSFARVLYKESNNCSELSPPADLEPILPGMYSDEIYTRLPHEPRSRTYPRWPLAFVGIRSWEQNPYIGKETKELKVAYDGYGEAVDWARAAEVVRTTGRPLNPRKWPVWGAGGLGSRWEKSGQPSGICKSRIRRVGISAGLDSGRSRLALNGL